MSAFMARLMRKAVKLESEVRSTNLGIISRYVRDPELYARERLGMRLTHQQATIMRLLLEPPHKVIVRAGHAVGKSVTAAVTTSWLYDTRNPVMIITTAPKEEQVRNIIWRELRKIRRKAGLGGFTGPSGLILRDSDEHMAIGVTANDSHSFQGKHEVNTYVIIDEAGGVKPEFFAAADTMVLGDEYGELVILNPLSTACQAYEEERSGNYHVVTMSCLDHPNMKEEMLGKKAPYPAAIRLQRVKEMISNWSDRVEPISIGPKDFEFPRAGDLVCPRVKDSFANDGWDVQYAPKKTRTGHYVVIRGQWWRPGPECEARVLGLWPTAGANTIWSEILFKRARANQLEIKPNYRTAIGCDVARYGDDLTEIAVRQGPSLLHLESHSGWDGSKICGRLKSLCHEFPGPEDPRKVRVFIDETGGLGTGPVDFAGDYNFHGINTSESAFNEEYYFNLRTQLWFDTRNLAKEGLLDLTRIPKSQARELERQLLAQKYKINSITGQSKALSKDEIKDELGRSPDTADCVNLAYIQLDPVRN